MPEPQTPPPANSETPAQLTASPTGPEPASSPAAPSSRRQALRDLRRQLSDEDLKNPAVLKVVLDDLDQAEADKEALKGYVDRYYEADKRAAVLQERLKPHTAIDIMFGAGVGLGGAIMGLAPFFWETSSPRGEVAMIVGALLIIGATIGRVKG